MIDLLAIQTMTLIAFIAFAAKRMMNFLHALQQNTYDNQRLISWVFKNKVFDTRVSFALIVIGVASIFVKAPVWAPNIFIFLVFIIAAYFEKDARKQSKTALVLTKRATRILGMGVFFSAILGALSYIIPSPFTWVIAVQLLPLMLVIGNASLNPYEGAVQKKFYMEAIQRLRDINPTIIAITGSYGKTSVKHILGHILENNAPTLMTPGSVNTLMGITRIIREKLQPHHKYFIVEMGAYGPGSIASLCALTPPDYGIISSIGHAHYERFKTLDTVVQAKYELAESVLERGGTMIVHEKTLKFQHSRDMRQRHMENFIACGEPIHKKDPKNAQEFSYLTPDDLKVKKIEQTPKGLCVNITWHGKKHTLRAPLYGIHHGHNIALAFACAMTLGMDAKDIKTALASTSQTKHRLEVKRQQDGTFIIDDTYNSNPPGFRAAMHVMKVLADDNEGRAILVTPGVLELGQAHDEAHKTLGALAAEAADIVLLINPSRIPSFIEGFDNANIKDKLLFQFESFTAAQEWLIDNKQSGDIILLANDLLDIYEQVLKI